MGALTWADAAQFVIGGGLTALIGVMLLWRRFPRESQRLDAQRDEIMQDLGRKNTEAATRVVDLVSDRMAEMTAALEEMRAERSGLRDRTLAAEAGEAGARVDTAQAVAELAVERAQRSQERHELRNELTTLAAQNELLRHEISQLRTEVSVLMAQQGLLQRRHT